MTALAASANKTTRQSAAAFGAIFSRRRNSKATPRPATESAATGRVCRKLDSAIMVVKAAEDRLRCDCADALNRAMKRGVLVQRAMSPQLIIVGSIRAEDSAQVLFPEHDHLVQALPADGADESLNISILPG